MLDLIREGWRRIARFFLGGKASPDRDVGESTGTAPQVSASVEVSPDQDVLESTGTASQVSASMEVSPDQEVVKCTGTASPVAASMEVSPDQDVLESTGTASLVSASMEVSPDQDVLESTGTAHPVESLSPPSVPTARTALPYDFSRWTISEYMESPFEKCGRLYLEGDDLVIRSDLDTRGFRIRLVDVVPVLNGEPQDIRLLKKGKKVGTARLSASGKAMNFVIDPFLYTAPLSKVMDVLEGRARKAAVFVGREMVE